MTTPNSNEPAKREDLVRFYEDAARPDPTTHLIGTELERFGVVEDGSGTLVPVSYAAHIAPVLTRLCDEHGWTVGPDRGVDGEIVELRRNNASITLEPGGQFELSGAPLKNVHETCAEFTQHYEELDAVSGDLGITWLASGHHPFATRDEINWMPKGRYAIMRDYLPTKGRYALDMMLRTCTIQANFDYASEQQCADRLRMASSISPIVTAMFANSPYVEGRATGKQSSRSWVWTEVDPDRCGLQPFFFAGRSGDKTSQNAGAFSFERYVDWALDVPMFFVKRDGRYHPHHAPFRSFLKDGFTDEGGKHHIALWSDWQTHLSTLFPEVRLKPHLEFRSVDAVSSRFVCAVPALLKGLIYDDDTCAEASLMLAELDFPGRIELWHEAATAGMRSVRVRGYAKRLLELAVAALEKMDVQDAQGRSEVRFLEPVLPLVEAGRSPADLVLADLGDAPGRGREGRQAVSRAWHFAGRMP